MDDTEASKPSALCPPSMFSSDLYDIMLKERMKDASHVIVGIEPGIPKKDSSKEHGSVSRRTCSVKLVYANTLASPKTFSPMEVKLKMESILKDKLQGQTYDPDACRSLSNSLGQEILAAVKGKGFHRYRYIVQVCLIEKRGQGVKISSKWLWDTQWDNWASAIFESTSLIANGLVFAMYRE